MSHACLSTRKALGTLLPSIVSSVETGSSKGGVLELASVGQSMAHAYLERENIAITK